MSLAYALANYIRAHGHPCRVLPDGRIKAACRGVLVSTGRTVWSVELLPASPQAVLTWLGY